MAEVSEEDGREFERRSDAHTRLQQSGAPPRNERPARKRRAQSLYARAGLGMPLQPTSCHGAIPPSRSGLLQARGMSTLQGRRSSQRGRNSITGCFLSSKSNLTSPAARMCFVAQAIAPKQAAGRAGPAGGEGALRRSFCAAAGRSPGPPAPAQGRLPSSRPLAWARPRRAGDRDWAGLARFASAVAEASLGRAQCQGPRQKKQNPLLVLSAVSGRMSRSVPSANGRLGEQRPVVRWSTATSGSLVADPSHALG